MNSTTFARLQLKLAISQVPFFAFFGASFGVMPSGLPIIITTIILVNTMICQGCLYSYRNNGSIQGLLLKKTSHYTIILLSFIYILINFKYFILNVVVSLFFFFMKSCCITSILNKKVINTNLITKQIFKKLNITKNLILIQNLILSGQIKLFVTTRLEQ